MKSIIVYCFMTAILFSCKISGSGKLNCSIDSIIIINKTANNKLPNRVIIADEKVIREFCNLINSKVDAGWPDVKDHSGFLEILVKMKDKRTKGIDIIYTFYDGIVIRYGMKYYKQSEIEKFIKENVYAVVDR